MDASQLRALTRHHLQQIAKRDKIKANIKSDAIISQLVKKYPLGVPPLDVGVPSSQKTRTSKAGVKHRESNASAARAFLGRFAPNSSAEPEGNADDAEEVVAGPSQEDSKGRRRSPSLKAIDRSKIMLGRDLAIGPFEPAHTASQLHGKSRIIYPSAAERAARRRAMTEANSQSQLASSSKVPRNPSRQRPTDLDTQDKAQEDVANPAVQNAGSSSRRANRPTTASQRSRTQVTRRSTRLASVRREPSPVPPTAAVELFTPVRPRHSSPLPVSHMRTSHREDDGPSTQPPQAPAASQAPPAENAAHTQSQNVQNAPDTLSPCPSQQSRLTGYTDAQMSQGFQPPIVPVRPPSPEPYPVEYRDEVPYRQRVDLPRGATESGARYVLRELVPMISECANVENTVNEVTLLMNGIDDEIHDLQRGLRQIMAKRLTMEEAFAQRKAWGVRDPRYDMQNPMDSGWIRVPREEVAVPADLAEPQNFKRGPSDLDAPYEESVIEISDSNVGSSKRRKLDKGKAVAGRGDF